MTKSLRLLLTIAFLLVPVAPAEACSSSASFIALDSLAGGAGSVIPFYYATEDSGSATFRITRISHECSNTAVSAQYSVEAVTATVGSDYRATTGRVELYDPEHGPGPYFQDVSVPLIDDETPEGVEEALVRLSDAVDAILIDPASAPLYLVDDDGAGAVTFAEGAYSIAEIGTVVRIPAFRSGAAHDAVTVPVTIGDGSATAGADYTSSATSISFGARQRLAFVELSIVDDDEGEADETVNVQLQDGTAQSMTLTIVDNEESVAPTSRLHHPRHARTYARSDPLLREIHIFTSDEGGSGVARARFALRRKLKDGTCAWWSRSGFERGDCSTADWVRARAREPGLYYFLRLEPLRPSVGTGIRNYTAFSRATDAAGNAETTFVSGRNRNTFEVRRG